MEYVTELSIDDAFYDACITPISDKKSNVKSDVTLGIKDNRFV